MKKNIYMRDEFVAKVGVSEKDLDAWEKLRLVGPTGYADDHTPCYPEEAVDRVMHIKKLVDLGYDPEEILKIIKRVGLPKSTEMEKQTPPKDQYLTVGNLAERVGLSPRTIKHWEDKGIIVPDMRSEGGFRLYSESYVHLCKLITDLQRFGYSLEEIKSVSDYFREFLNIKENVKIYSMPEVDRKLDTMLSEIQGLNDKIGLLKGGIQRWEDLIKKKKREIQQLKGLNRKRAETGKEKKNG